MRSTHQTPDFGGLTFENENPSALSPLPGGFGSSEWPQAKTAPRDLARRAAGTSRAPTGIEPPRLNPGGDKITGVVCGVRVEEVEEETMREIRYLDKLIDELAKGKAMAKILRD